MTLAGCVVVAVAAVVVVAVVVAAVVAVDDGVFVDDCAEVFLRVDQSRKENKETRQWGLEKMAWKGRRLGEERMAREKAATAVKAEGEEEDKRRTPWPDK